MIGVDYKYNFKFIVIGSSGVGKTALLSRLIDGTFSPENQSTIGVEYLSTVIEVDGNPIKLQIWDTAGQEKFRAIAKSYFRNAVGVILVYDITDRKSFDDLALWLNDVHTLCDPNAAVTLIGNKLDLSSSRAITTSEATSFANTHHLLYLETSARGGDNVQEAFARATKSVYDRVENGQIVCKTTTTSQKKAKSDGGCQC
ncbi:guanine nucleotide regulatory protein, putative [Trichomonas vaginalis G3]|uniref:Guanine nucleotide regulatory protein, putative n=1 Tax=Trichomonas vaginalis (strain ATCC PRA-98 / G3) TaxID=412133 RepID=A2FJF4_TRIV3|nr:regulation of endocytosis [Trichomonas vaginalis G3]EAX94967.1 guanine nucleotide regulatory protein, putative [Trichomonas vaginalis G3]KAI5501519.1 regulation of endocytosis [Trichomonas vaginalis G3]|eukprot:XP_001307897.1 guanine nucleotide regulatory protein [Trichomonas vaginalis G3]